MKGNEKDCICEKPKGKHKKNCDVYRLSEFFKSAAIIKLSNGMVLSAEIPKLPKRIHWLSREEQIKETLQNLTNAINGKHLK